MGRTSGFQEMTCNIHCALTLKTIDWFNSKDCIGNKMIKFSVCRKRVSFINNDGVQTIQIGGSSEPFDSL